MIEITEEIEAYIARIDSKRQSAFRTLFNTIALHLPDGFEALIQYGMPTFVVPLKHYPDGYLKRRVEPLPIMSIAAQKHSINLYHMGLYSDAVLKEWFIERYKEEVPTKLDMGKSCVRMRNVNNIPFDLIGELSGKITVERWIEIYEMRHRDKC